MTDFVYAPPQTGFNNWWIDRLRSRRETRRISYLGGHALPGGLPAGFSAADVTGTQTATELFGWNTVHRKPACVYRIAGPDSAEAASDACTLTPDQPYQFTGMAYDRHGNPEQERAMASDQQSEERLTDMGYTVSGHFRPLLTNPLQV